MAYRVDKKAALLRLGRKKSLTSTAREMRTTEADLIRQSVGEGIPRKILPRLQLPISSRGLVDRTAAERVDELLTGFGRR